MPTQQRPNRVLTESSADQFYLIRQLNFQKLVLASQFLFARYFLRLAREVVPLYWHCLVMVAFDALVHQLDQVPEVFIYCIYKIELKLTEKNELKEIKILVILYVIVTHNRNNDCLIANDCQRYSYFLLLDNVLAATTTLNKASIPVPIQLQL
ncbi:Hypothetical_protein [Hexamita inflata]|uniref:Hypothetical_protein n=1 Tax=Hexamita inflata TaxID=28002 RepID=A0AA86Q5Q7_9EUKA|nr:Hypothetical protein HINF_LOCUS40519 [Hexamita inflata]